jgi:hypothetical protein
VILPHFIQPGNLNRGIQIQKDFFWLVGFGNEPLQLELSISTIDQSPLEMEK